MLARINHVAICSDHYALNGRFYEALFGMKPSSKPRPARSVVLGDGYVGMNLIPRRDGRGILLGKDWAGSNSATPYQHEGKTWFAVQIGFDFSK